MALGTLTPYDISTAPLIEGLILQQDLISTIPNITGRVTRSVVITPGAVTQEITTYRLREVNTNQTISFVSDASPTAAEVVTGLTTAFRANMILSGLGVASGTTTLITTSRQTGARSFDFDFVEGGSTPTNLLSVAAETVGADAATLGFGRGMVFNSANNNANLISAALSTSNPFAGVTGFTQADIDYVGQGVSGYPSEAAVNLVRRGVVAVFCATPVDPTSQVWLSFSGANRGRFRATDSGASDNSQILAGCGWRSRNTAAGLAVLSLNFPA